MLIAALSLFSLSLSSAHESSLIVDYDLKCQDGSTMVNAEIHLPGRILRVDLFSAAHHREFNVGTIDLADLASGKIPELKLGSNLKCELTRLEAQLKEENNSIDAAAERGRAPLTSSFTDEIERLALAHSPFIVVRDDQYANRETDLPLELVYNVEVDSLENVSIKYTMFFSDEDSKTSKSDTEGQMARYGRRADVEWAYMVVFDKERKILRRMYQGGFSLTNSAADLGHSFQFFQGAYLPGTSHPILYNSQKNNVFSDKPSQKQAKLGVIGHHLVPRIEIPYPMAREWAMLKNAWMYEVSDQELAREGKLTNTSLDYLYVLLEGTMTKGAFTAALKLDGHKDPVKSGAGESDIDRLGEDMWWRQSLTALPIGQMRLGELLEGKLHGELTLKNTSFRKADVALTGMRFFRLLRTETGYSAKEITKEIPKLNCDIDYQASLTGSCSF